MPPKFQPAFLFCTCQQGAGPALKAEVAANVPGAVPAFSRPGFVTFKLEQPLENPSAFALKSVFARSWSLSLVNVREEPFEGLVAGVRSSEPLAQFIADHRPKQLHVWQRDRAQAGESDFEPGPTETAANVRNALLEGWEAFSPDQGEKRSDWIIDVVLVDESDWWVGCHRANTRAARWAGGVPAITLPEHAVSRAYLKMDEALRWSAFPAEPEDLWVELGCAPGGASQALLDRGMIVVGVDPAEVDPKVAEHPRFAHARRRVKELPTKWLREVQWLAADMNVAPTYTLDAVEGVLAHRASTIRGLVLTLKLSDWSAAEHLQEHADRVRSWGYRDVRLRQLAFNRREVCLVALRSRGQRRVRRSGKRAAKPILSESD